MKIARDPVFLVTKKKIQDTGDNPNKYVKVRKFKYVGSLNNKLWEEAQQPVADGGFPGLKDENGELKIYRTVFEELIPDHFGRLLTESHKRGYMCTIEKKTLETQIADLNKWLSKNPHHQERQQKRQEYKDLRSELKDFLNAAFFEYTNGKFSPKYYKFLEDLVNKEMTCRPNVGDTNMCSNNSCYLNRWCVECRNFPRHPGEHHKEVPKEIKEHPQTI
jgi:hypothetical protein